MLACAPHPSSAHQPSLPQSPLAATPVAMAAASAPPPPPPGGSGGSGGWGGGGGGWDDKWSKGDWGWDENWDENMEDPEDQVEVDLRRALHDLLVA